MVSARISPFIWKWAVSLLAVCIGVMLQAELRVGYERLKYQQGSLGITLVDQTGVRMEGLGTHWLRVAQVDQGSDAYTKGVRAGDRLRFDRPLDRWRRFVPGEQVGLSVNGRRLPEKLNTVGQDFTERERADYIGRALIALPALIFAVLVAWYQPAQRAYRSLAAMFLCTALAFYSSFMFSAPGSLGAVGKLLQPSSKCLLWMFAADFALHYGVAHGAPPRPQLAAAAQAYRALALGAAAGGALFVCGLETPLLWVFFLMTIAGGCTVLLLGLLDGWHASRGELRQRYRWLLLAVGLGAGPTLLLNLPALDLDMAAGEAVVALYFIGQIAMYCLLAYAVLRYRVFDFYLAVSRTIVFLVISAGLTYLFAQVSYGIHEGMPKVDEASPAWKALLEASPALLFFLLFGKLHAWVEHAVRLLFFRRWAARDRALRAWCADIAQLDTTSALLGSLTGALDRFTCGSGTAVYLCGPDNAAVLVASTLAGVPQGLAPDAPMLVTLRADLAPSREGLPQGPGGLALPMCHRGQLHGAVLAGARADGECFRPDEVALLAQAVHLAGLALHALRAEELQRAVALVEEETRRADEALLALAGRRHIAGAPA